MYTCKPGSSRYETFPPFDGRFFAGEKAHILHTWKTQVLYNVFVEIDCFFYYTILH